MRLLLVFMAAALTLAAQQTSAEKAWAKVQALHGGTELRIYKKGARQPVLAKFSDASDDSLIAIVKNEEVSIAKDDIDRLDYRPPRAGPRATTETRATTTQAHGEPMTPGVPESNGAPQSSSSSSVSFGSKPDFEILYRRPPGTSPK